MIIFFAAGPVIDPKNYVPPPLHEAGPKSLERLPGTGMHGDRQRRIRAGNGGSGEQQGKPEPARHGTTPQARRAHRFRFFAFLVGMSGSHQSDHESRVTHAIRRVQVRPGPELTGLKEHLERAYLGEEGHLADAGADSVFSIPGPLRGR